MAFNKKPRSDEEYARYANALTGEFQSDSVRAIVIAGATLVDDRLSTALDSVFSPEGDAWDELTKQMSPMHNFSARIEFARVTNVIAEGVRLDLRDIKELRNEFAHYVLHRKTGLNLDWDNEWVRTRCFRLRYVPNNNKTDPKAALLNVCAGIAYDLETLATFGMGRLYIPGLDPGYVPADQD